MQMGFSKLCLILNGMRPKDKMCIKMIHICPKLVAFYGISVIGESHAKSLLCNRGLQSSIESNDTVFLIQGL